MLDGPKSNLLFKRLKDIYDKLVNGVTATISDPLLVRNYIYNGSSWVEAEGTAANGQEVDVTRVQGTVNVTQSGTWDIDTINNPVTVTGTLAATQSGSWTFQAEAGTNRIGYVGITDDDGSTHAFVGQSGRWGTSLGSYTQQGLTVNTRFHFIWDADHPDVTSADQNWYAGSMDDNGNFNCNMSSVGGNLVNLGQGNSTGPTNSGVQRVVVATDDPNLSAIKTAIELIDDDADDIRVAVQDKSTALDVSNEITSVAKSTTDGDIIAAAGSGVKIKIYHISVNNAGSNDTNFQILDGSGGTVIREYLLAKNGGTVETQFNPPIEGTANTALYYNWISGSSADINITVHYKEV